MNASYYIAKGQKTLGPCTLDDLRNFLAYGSIQKGDLVMRTGEEQWRPVATLMEIVAEPGVVSEDGAVQPALRRRTVRYRDYERVPPERRAGLVLKWLLWGFFLFPPLLWRAAVSIYSNSIFRRAANDDGYLKIWPRWIEALVTVLIMVNAIAWWTGITWLADASGAHFRELIDAMKSATRTIREMF
ncbi:MAG: DUF4339 domain-containing protein [Verrucomicrobiaceae bacterium]|nr:DUF4339 domain-containing protein [Verrucomicrobiaceae bacterium]